MAGNDAYLASAEPASWAVISQILAYDQYIDKSCIVYILNFICNLAMKHNLPTIVIFDQPLYWKAAVIIIDAPQNSHLTGVVLMLGCSHTLMILLGAIGTLMEGPDSKTYLRLSMEKMQSCT